MDRRDRSLTKRRKKTRKSSRKKSSVPASVVAAARGVSVFLGVFSLLNILGDIRSPGFNANHWWIDLQPVHPLAADVFLGLTSAVLIAFAVRPVQSPGRRILTFTCTAALLVVAIWNAIVFYVILAGKGVQSGFPVAFSIFVAAALVLIILGLAGEAPKRGGRKKTGSMIVVCATCAACCIAFPLAQIYCFGKTDYRRPADIAVVFGARVYADGRVSDALADRVRTGCRLYEDGLAAFLVLSGGPGDGRVHETEAMLGMALELGVPREAILLDDEGVNTHATVENTAPLFEHIGAGSVLVVSHFYHLPRIKMSYQRLGWEVYTVPAEESYRLSAMPKFIAREVAALWVYYLSPLVP